jgi:hypothetical protein
MSIYQQIAKAEEDFQTWFRAASAAISNPDFSAKNLEDIPLPLGGKQWGYNYLFKQTIRVPEAFRTRPEEFQLNLKEFLVDSAYLMYGNHIRLAVSNFDQNRHGVGIFKECGQEIGMFLILVRLEGYIVNVEVVYQIFGKTISLLDRPDQLRKNDEAAIANTSVIKLFKKAKWISLKRVILIFIFLFATMILLAKSIPHGVAAIPVGLFVFLLGGAFCIDQLSSYRIEIDKLKWQANHRIKYELSSIHFPLVYFDHSEVLAAIQNNQDHQIYIKQISSMIEKAAAIGEQSS